MEAWVNRLAGEAPVVQARPAGLSDIPTACRWASVGGVAGLAKLIEKGEVKVRARFSGARGLYSLLVDPIEVKRAGRVQSGGALSPREAAKLLSMHPDSVWACIRDGLLEYAPHGAQQAAISQEAIDRFRATYVTTSELAKNLGTVPQWLGVVLRENCITPVAATETTSRMRVAIYRRSDIPADFAERYRRRYRRRRDGRPKPH